MRVVKVKEGLLLLLLLQRNMVSQAGYPSPYLYHSAIV